MAGNLKLKEYNEKRDFHRTPEPSGTEPRPAEQCVFTVQEHHARRLHYDFRLELEGVLKSWAVPKGPSSDPQIRRLAVQTEDHPLSYATFAGDIPKGEYGAGHVKVWDQGVWKPIDKDPVKALKKGKLKFLLHGKKLHGIWTLIRTDVEKRQWLLLKNQEDSPSITLPEAAVPGSMPEHMPPQLATLSARAPSGEDWLHEIKLDGYRMMSFVEGGTARLETRRGLDWSERFPAITHRLAELPVENAILDGEIVALNSDGISDFQALQNNIKGEQDAALVYYVFDITFYNGYDLRNCPLEERKTLLKKIIAPFAGPQDKVRYTKHVEEQGDRFLKISCDLGLEGIISKHKTSQYKSKRVPSWVKTKCTKRQEFLVIGYTESTKHARPFGALHLGYYDANGALTYAGKVGTGFNHHTFRWADKAFAPLRTAKSPLSDGTKDISKAKTHWLRPKLIAEVAFTDWTTDRRLRHPSFQGFREDKAPEQITLETEVETETKTPENSPARDVVAGVSLSSPDRVLYPEQGIRKYDLAVYYESVADFILPELQDRLLSLVRCPQGHEKSCFFQRHLQGLGGEGVHSLEGPGNVKQGPEPYMYLSNLQGLIRLVQNGTLEFHIWSSRIDRLDRPDRIVFDLDPGPGISWSEVIEAAKLVRDELSQIGLTSFVRTTGGKGLHVCLPITRLTDFDTVSAWTAAFANHMVDLLPDFFVATMSKRKRKNKIFIDHFRNKLSATSVASYSSRARRGAPVSLPLTWEELDHLADPGDFNVYTAPSILKDRGDAWHGMAGLRQSLRKDVLAFVGL